VSAGTPQAPRGGSGVPIEGEGKGSLALPPGESESQILARLEAVHRMRVLLSFMLLPPLLFFVFLVVWAHEGLILVPIGAGLYLYMLIQFFILQNPARRMRRRGAGT